MTGGHSNWTDVLDMDISFTDKLLHRTVYIKMDAHDQLLLSESICRQLEIVSYHASIDTRESLKKQAEAKDVAIVQSTW